jgi:hypothetical protein
MSAGKPGLLCRHIRVYIRVYQCSSVVLFCMDAAQAPPDRLVVFTMDCGRSR